MDLQPAARAEAIKGLLEDGEMVVERGIHQAHEYQIEGVGENPLVVLAVLLDERAVTRGIDWLDKAEVGSDDLRVGVLTGKLAGPDSCAGTDIQDLAWSSNRSFAKLAPVIELENPVLEIQPVLLGL